MHHDPGDGGADGMTWLYKYILLSDWPSYRAKGWKKLGPMRTFHGWGNVIVRKKG